MAGMHLTQSIGAHVSDKGIRAKHGGKEGDCNQICLVVRVPVTAVLDYIMPVICSNHWVVLPKVCDKLLISGVEQASCTYV